MLSAASNIRDIHHTLEVVHSCWGLVVARIHCFGVVVVARIRCFVEDTVAAAAFAAVGAGRTVAVVADIAAAAASAGAEADCTAAFAAVAVVVAGCTDLGVLAEADCWRNRCCDFGHHRFVLLNVVGPGELAGFLHGQV